MTEFCRVFDHFNFFRWTLAASMNWSFGREMGRFLCLRIVSFLFPRLPAFSIWGGPSILPFWFGYMVVVVNFCGAFVFDYSSWTKFHGVFVSIMVLTVPVALNSVYISITSIDAWRLGSTFLELWLCWTGLSHHLSFWPSQWFGAHPVIRIFL